MHNQQPKVLVIDDSQSTLNLVTGYLETLDVQVFTATNVAQGLALAREQHPDLVLCDIIMPGGDGYGLIQALRADQSLAHVPVVLMSGVSAMQDRLKAVDSGADDLLSKPFDRAELVSRVKALLRLKRREDEIQLANAELRERLRLLSTLFIVSNQLSKSLDAGEILRVINETLITIAEAEAFTIYLRDSDAACFHLVVCHGLENECFSEEITTSELPQLLSKVVESRQPFFNDNDQKPAPVVFGETLLASVPVITVMPLVAGESVIGLINIHAFSTEAGQTPDYELLTLIGSQASGAIHAVNIVGQLKEYAAELEDKDQRLREANKTLEEELFHFNTLTLFSAQLHSTINLADIYEKVRDLAINFIGTQIFYTRYYGEWGEISTYAGVADNIPEAARETDTEKYKALEDEVMKAKLAFFASNPDAQFEHLISKDSPLPQACLPLMVENKARGTLVIEQLLPHKSGFTKQDFELLALLTREAARAIHNGYLHRQIERLSAIDGLTGAYNRRYFDERLIDELRRALRYEHPLSLVMVDIDDFKNINDRYGHLVGDEVLVEIVRRLSKSLRDVDVVCRYGGDEFTLILPATGRESAALAADRIMAACRDSPILSGENSIPVTLSIGIACSPPHSDVTALMDTADQALLQAKRGDKDRVVIDDNLN